MPNAGSCTFLPRSPSPHTSPLPPPPKSCPSEAFPSTPSKKRRLFVKGRAPKSCRRSQAPFFPSFCFFHFYDSFYYLASDLFSFFRWIERRLHFFPFPECSKSFTAAIGKSSTVKNHNFSFQSFFFFFHSIQPLPPTCADWARFHFCRLNWNILLDILPFTLPLCDQAEEVHVFSLCIHDYILEVYR